jgi:sugar phosphate isomerase/epimerase
MARLHGYHALSFLHCKWKVIGRVTLTGYFGRRAMLAGLVAAGSASMLETTAMAKGPKTFFNRVKLPIGLQIYSLGDEPMKDLDGTFAKVAAIGYRDIELPSLLGKTAAQVKAAADRAGLKISALHVPAAPMQGPTAGTFQDSAQNIVDIMGALGVKNAVAPIMLFPSGMKFSAGESFQTVIARAMKEAGADIWKRTAALLNEKAQSLKPHGIHVGYHNHNLEFAPIGNTTGWDILMAEFDPKLVSIELDIGWVTAAGLDPVAFINKHKGRLRQMHVKDVQATTKPNFTLSMDPTQIGDGQQDWAKILPAAYKAGVRNFYVEQEPPFAMARMDAVKRSFGYLEKLKA